MGVISLIFGLVCILIGLRIVHHVVVIFIVSRRFRRVSCSASVKDKEPIIIFVLPLLEEQEEWPDAAQRFQSILKKYSFTRFWIITTEREYAGSKAGTSTIDLIKQWYARQPASVRSRVRHIHYPRINKHLAEQLNYGLKAGFGDMDVNQSGHTFFVFYNADSRPGIDVVPVFLEMLSKTNGVVFQQSTVFLANMRELVRTKSYYGLANGIFQSVWTFTHEIPRLLKSALFPSWQLAHCVSHGLFIRADVLAAVDYFPEDSPGEDLYMGFIIRSHGIPIYSLPVLEWGKTPALFWSVLRQKYVWFWGPLGYFFYWRRIRNRFPALWKTRRIHIMLLTVQGILSAINWLLVSYVFMGIIIVGVYSSIWVGVVLFMAYCWLPSAMLLVSLYTQPSAKEYKKWLVHPVTICALTLSYPFVVLTHSFPTIYTLFKEVKLRVKGWDSFLRPKTKY